MNRDNAKDYLPLVQALADGKTIQIQNKECFDGWENIRSPHFDFTSNCYRIKPEPFECWVNIYSSVAYVHDSAQAANRQYGDATGCGRCAVHMREVE